MKIKVPLAKERCFTSIINLYHLFYLHNIKEILIDVRCKKYVDAVFQTIGNVQVDFNIVDPLTTDYIRSKDVTAASLPEILQNSKLKSKYDLSIVHADNFRTFVPLLHRARFVFVYDAKNDDRIYIPYTRLNDCFEGFLYINDFHSMIFPNFRLDVFQQTYVRDKPYRFLRKIQELLRSVGAKTIVEIGTCRSALNHELKDIDPMCCNDSHSTFFWCETRCVVHTVDVNPNCERILKNAYAEGKLKIGGKLDIVNEDGIAYLQDYDDEPIDFLFLDAWDVIDGSDYAEKHLEAYTMAKEHLSQNGCLIAIDDTDIANGGKGRLLMPRLVNDGWIMLYRGRQTVFYKGPLDKLFAPRCQENAP